MGWNPQEAITFFRDHAPYSYDPKTETAEQGRLRCAAILATAEHRLKVGPYYVDREPDSEPYDGTEPYDGPVWVVRLWSVAGATEGEVIGSVGSVACEADSPYLRVVAAQLAAEHILAGV